MPGIARCLPLTEMLSVPLAVAHLRSWLEGVWILYTVSILIRKEELIGRLLSRQCILD